MRLSVVLSRCAATASRAIRRVAAAVGRVARAAIAPTVAAIRSGARRACRRAATGWRFGRLAAPLFAAACGRAESPTPVPSSPQPDRVTAASPVAPEPDAGVDRPLGSFHLTFYYVADEDEVGASSRRRAPSPSPSSGEPADTTLAAGMPDLVPIFDRRCEPLGNVSRAFARQLAMQGTGRLRDGRVLNVSGPCDCPRTPCFHVLPSNRKWGTGEGGRPLEPFRTVAVDPRKVPLGSSLYIPELDGVRMPGPRGVGGFVHDGCVVAGDTGGGVRGAQLDLFVARRAYYHGLARRGGSHGWARSVEVFDGARRCTGRGGETRSAAGAI